MGSNNMEWDQMRRKKIEQKNFSNKILSKSD